VEINFRVFLATRAPLIVANRRLLIIRIRQTAQPDERNLNVARYNRNDKTLTATSYRTLDVYNTFVEIDTAERRIACADRILLISRVGFVVRLLLRNSVFVVITRRRIIR